MDLFAAYGHAIVAMAIFAVMTLVLGPVAAIAKQRSGLAPGAQPVADYSDKGYRLHRAHGNAAETAGIFALVTLAAILAGAAAFWVNLFTGLFLLARILMLVVHVGGIGGANAGLRSMSYAFGKLMCLLLAVLAIIAVFGG